jgi:hypothetical protein
VSNSRRTRWTEAQITAANAELALRQLAEGEMAAATREVVAESLVADLTARGHPVGLVARLEQGLMQLGEDFWVEQARRIGVIGD